MTLSHVAVAFQLVTLLATSGPVALREAPVICPAHVEVEEKPTGLSSEWSWEKREVQHRLIGVDFFELYEGTRETLAPSQTPGKKGEVINRWEFPSSASVLGVVCIYENTGIRLVTTLPAGTRECSVHLSERAVVGGLPEVKRVECAVAAGRPK